MIKRIIKHSPKAKAKHDIEGNKTIFADLYCMPYAKSEYKGKKPFQEAQYTYVASKVFIAFPIGIFFLDIELRCSDEWCLFPKIAFKYSYGVVYTKSH